MNQNLSKETEFTTSCEELEQAAYRAAQLYIDIFSGLESRRVDPGVSRDQMQSLFSNSVPEEGNGMMAALDDFEQKVLPHSMGTPHPLYWGLVNSSPLPTGPLADLLISSLNNNGGAFHQSPAISAIEQEVIREFGRLVGWNTSVSGMILPGGTFANLQGLLLARQAHFPKWLTDGPQSLTGQPIVYQSDVTHFCNDRAALVMGIGQNGLVSIPSVGRGSIDVQALEDQIKRDRQAGHVPFAVVANGGTTGTGAIDQLGDLSEVCKNQGLWLHVDACYGGAALLLEPGLPEFVGIDRADSIAIDPHKWFFIPMTAGLLLTRHHNLEVEAFDIAASYIPGDGTVDAFRRGIPTSRRSSALAIWMTLRAHGWKSIREAVARNIRFSRQIESLLMENGFRVLEDGKLSVACARWEPEGISPPELDTLQSAIAEKVIQTGRAWFSTVRHRDEIWLRLNLVNIHTTEKHVEELAALITSITAKGGF